MLTVDMSAREKLVEMRDRYALREPVVVFGMAAKFEDGDNSVAEAFASGGRESLLGIFTEKYKSELNFSFALTFHERSDLGGSDFFLIDDFCFHMPTLIKDIADNSALFFDGSDFFLCDHAGKVIDLPLA